MASLDSHLTSGILLFCLLGTMIIVGLPRLTNIWILYNRGLGIQTLVSRCLGKHFNPEVIFSFPVYLLLWIFPHFCALSGLTAAHWDASGHVHVFCIWTASQVDFLWWACTRNTCFPRFLCNSLLSLKSFCLRFEFLSSEVSISKPNLPGSRFIFAYISHLISYYPCFG